MPKTFCGYCRYKVRSKNPYGAGCYYCAKFKVWDLEERKRLCNGQHKELKDADKA